MSSRNKLVAISLTVGALAMQACDRKSTEPVTAVATEPAPVTAPVTPPPPAYTLRDLMLSGAADLAADKRRSVLYVSRNAPRVKLYDTQATHPVCKLNGKPTQVAEAGNGGFTCYRWVGDEVMLRIEGNQWAVMDGSNFRAK